MRKNAPSDFQTRLEACTKHFEAQHYAAAYENLGASLRLSKNSAHVIHESYGDLRKLSPSQPILDLVQSEIETRSTNLLRIASIGEVFQPEEVLLLLHHRMGISDILRGLEEGFQITLALDISELDTKLQRMRRFCKSRVCNRLFHILYA